MPAPAMPPAPGGARASNMFDAQKCWLGLVVRTIGMVHARAKIGPADLACNFACLLWLTRRAGVSPAPARRSRQIQPSVSSSPEMLASSAPRSPPR
jgi:hypothetical protein